DLQGNHKQLSGTFGSTQGLAWSPDQSEIWFSAVKNGVYRSLYQGGDNGESYQCSSRTSCRAQSGAVASREVGSSDFSNRIAKRFGKIQQHNSSETNNLSSFEAENGTGSEG
ncbi:MAG: hypothetical protein WBV36_09245, partial [Terriglobales bacterium]